MIYLIFFLIFITLFNPILSYWIIPEIKYVDDIFLVFSFLILISNFKKIKNLKINFLLILLLVSGFIGSFFFSQSINFTRFSLGYLYIIKPILFFISGLFLSKYAFYNEGKIINFLKTISLFVFFSFLMNIFFLDKWDYITGNFQIIDNKIRVQGIFTNVGRSAWYLGVIFIVFNSNNFKNKIVQIISLIFLYLTYIKKTILGIFFIVLFNSRNFKFYKRFFVFVVLSALIFIFWESVFLRFYEEYNYSTFTEKNSRIALFYGVYLLLNNWQIILFGTGFGYYGGFVSSFFYSPIYFDLGFSDLHGFKEGNSTYTGDNYIAHIVAELGIVGSVIFFIMLYRLFQFILDKKKYIFFENFKLIRNLLILVSVESIAISALEISQVSMITFFIPGLIIGKNTKFK